jgi:hypothetical protein
MFSRSGFFSATSTSNFDSFNMYVGCKNRLSSVNFRKKSSGAGPALEKFLDKVASTIDLLDRAQGEGETHKATFNVMKLVYC